ncbi:MULTISPECIES: phosphatase PAP2 family protein [Amycolatopsis]|nr:MULTISPECIES: phosphatase PAP2 family protein [Amycolatopsis]MBB2500801.1 phosphatase PAP2 family protein [Amycolatopsis echigonensis]MCG3751242.1 phosphatase PAP2 family protein [Amycolatopsis sp. Poz14]
MVTTLGETPVAWAAVGASCLLTRSGGRAAPIVTLAVAAALRRGLADLIDRPRPPERLWRTEWSGPSFPSRHTTLGTLGAGLVAVNLLRRPGIVAVPVAAAVGISRIVLGVHWPTDVLAGWAFAAAALALSGGRRRNGRR